MEAVDKYLGLNFYVKNLDSWWRHLGLCQVSVEALFLFHMIWVAMWHASSRCCNGKPCSNYSTTKCPCKCSNQTLEDDVAWEFVPTCWSARAWSCSNSLACFLRWKREVFIFLHYQMLLRPKLLRQWKFSGMLSSLKSQLNNMLDFPLMTTLFPE